MDNKLLQAEGGKYANFTNFARSKRKATASFRFIVDEGRRPLTSGKVTVMGRDSSSCVPLPGPARRLVSGLIIIKGKGGAQSNPIEHLSQLAVRPSTAVLTK